jgi:hypothetical protein
MCDLCDELDCQIERCRKIKEATVDDLMLDAVAMLIKSYEQDKRRLHLEQADRRT